MEIRSKRGNVNTRIAELEEQLEILNNPRVPTQWKPPGKWKRTLNNSHKKMGQGKIVFIYLRKNGVMEEPQLVPYKDDVVVYNNKAYEVDPRAMWRWGKFTIFIYKEMDRRPVSNLNLRAIHARGDLTDSDEILIKATMRAIQEGIKKKMNKAALIIGALVIAGIVIAIIASGGGGA